MWNESFGWARNQTPGTENTKTDLEVAIHDHKIRLWQASSYAAPFDRLIHGINLAMALHYVSKTR